MSTDCFWSVGQTTHTGDDGSVSEMVCVSVLGQSVSLSSSAARQMAALILLCADDQEKRRPAMNRAVEEVKS